MLDLAIVRVLFILVLAGTAAVLHPFHTSVWQAAAGGILIGLAIIVFEIRLERISLKRLIGAAAGSVLGIVGSFLISLVLAKAGAESSAARSRAPSEPLRSSIRA